MKLLRGNLLILLWILGLSFGGRVSSMAQSGNAIQPYEGNPWYWQYKGEPVVLLGASDDDNLFQWPGETLTNHLDILEAVEGNFLRNTMSDREPGNVFAFKKISETQYDLNEWNDEYWDRLTFFLDETARREMIVQLTLWDHFDISASFRFDRSPWKPENNVNMASGTWQSGRDFYTTVNRNDTEGLKYQKQFIDKLLSVTFQYDHVIYNINNESDESVEWELFWARHLKNASREKGVDLYLTTLQFDPANAVRFVMSHPGLFDFVEVSQNNQNSRGARGPAHWDNLMSWRQKLNDFSAGPMPMNNEKVYGGKDGLNYSSGTGTEAVNRVWRNLIGGSAASRFHRPAGDVAPWGSGLSERVQTHLKAMRMFLDEFDIFSAAPHNDLLVSRVRVSSTQEAYLSANIGSQYAVYFPEGRFTVAVDPWVYVTKVELKWLDIEAMEWSESEIIEVQWEGGHEDWGYRGTIHLETPGNRTCVAVINVIE